MLLSFAVKCQAGSDLDLFQRFSQTLNVAAFLLSGSSDSTLPDMPGFHRAEPGRSPQ